MQSLSSKILNAKVEEGNILVFSLGQAGFVFKTSKTLIALDLYLSNCCERFFNFKRLMAYVLEPEEIVFDYVLTSHAHYDHFDIDSVNGLLKNGKTKLIGAKDCQEECKKLNLTKNLNFLAVNDVFEENGLKITAFPCDHGKDTPYALGFIIQAEGKKIYVAGDTSYREDIFTRKELENLDLFIFPINGAFGNMNGIEGANACNLIKAKLSIPCHFWCFAEHFGSPIEYMNKMSEYNNKNYLLLRQGEEVKI